MGKSKLHAFSFPFIFKSTIPLENFISNKTRKFAGLKMKNLKSKKRPKALSQNEKSLSSAFFTKSFVLWKHFWSFLFWLSYKAGLTIRWRVLAVAEERQPKAVAFLLGSSAARLGLV